jgi:ankyrin repeat protein
MEGAMFTAVSFGHAKIVQLLLEYGGAGEDPKGALAPSLREAIIRRHTAVVQQLSPSVADANSCGEDGTSILHRALIRGFDDIAMLLIENGAFLLQDDVYAAISSGCLQALREQVKRGGLDFKHYGRKPLELTVEIKNRQLQREMKSFLIKHGATG